jgi:hypothetical protein
VSIYEIDGIVMNIRVNIRVTAAEADRILRHEPLIRRAVISRPVVIEPLAIVLAAGDELPGKVDPALLKAVSRARAWFEELASGRVQSFSQIAKRENVTRRYVERLSRLAFVAPAIVEAICQGRQPADLSAETLLKRIDLPLDWSSQVRALGC